MKAMIVEDEILVRLGLRKAIPWPALGMELACEAKDGEEAFDLFKQHRPDIVLVDIELPKMDGLKFIRYAKSHHAGARFIVLTCQQDMKYTREAIQLQVSDFILKSTLDMSELCGILQNLSLEIVKERIDAEQAKSSEPTTDRMASGLLPFDYYEEEHGFDRNHSPFHDVMSETVQKRKKIIYECIESLRIAVAKQRMTELKAELRQHQPPFLHPNIVKNMITEFLFRMWSACEEIASGKQAANHLLVDRIYASRTLEQTFSLAMQEMERAEADLSLTNTGEDKAKVILLIKQYIKTHLHEEISLQDIADSFYINSTYLSRLFKEVSRMSFTEFVLFEKTELAILMMKNGKSLTEISDKLGYLNLSSFTRMFKKVRGSSPSRYLQSQDSTIG
ncbi:response regulator transcription factor [Cohnella soli]|uniref:Response regulator n=1 Tax=Cohnella soli TaxID=425005 RepID=A0ABW0HWC6_9BACL